MDSITQDIKYRLAILSYTEKNGVTKAAIKYRTNRQFIYRLRQRYDGPPSPSSRSPVAPIPIPGNIQRRR